MDNTVAPELNEFKQTVRQYLKTTLANEATEPVNVKQICDGETMRFKKTTNEHFKMAAYFMDEQACASSCKYVERFWKHVKAFELTTFER